MEIFYPVFLYYWILGLTSTSETFHGRLKRTILAALPLFLLLALRSPYCGNDLLSSSGNEGGYYMYFSRVSESSFSDVIKGNVLGIELGWQILNWAISRLSIDFQFFIASISAIQIVLIAYTIYKKSKDIVMSFMIYACMGLFLFSFSGIRQATAYAITLFAYNFYRPSLKDKSNILFLFFVIIAAQCHTSAIFFSVIPICTKFRITRTSGIVFLVALFSILPFLSSITVFISSELFGGRGKGYIDGGGAITQFLFYVFLYILSLINDSYYENQNVHRWFLLLACACQSTGIISNGSLTRVSYYFTIMFLLILPEILQSLKYGRKTITYLCYMTMMMYLAYIAQGGVFNALPYHFFWETL